MRNSVKNREPDNEREIGSRDSIKLETAVKTEKTRGRAKDSAIETQIDVQRDGKNRGKRRKVERDRS